MKPFDSKPLITSISSYLAAAALVACSVQQSPPSGSSGGAPAAAPSGSSGGTSSSSGAPNAPNGEDDDDDDDLPGTDAGADAPTKPARTLPPHCPASSSYPLICLETAEGKPGDVVDLEVHLVPSDGCTSANDAYGRVRFDSAYFELVNDADQVACTSRHQIPDLNDPEKDQITWQKFGVGSIAGCDAPVGIGKVDVIKVRIKPGTPPGDYALVWETTEFLGPTVDCQVIDNGAGSTVRVLP